MSGTLELNENHEQRLTVDKRRRRRRRRRQTRHQTSSLSLSARLEPDSGGDAAAAQQVPSLAAAAAAVVDKNTRALGNWRLRSPLVAARETWQRVRASDVVRSTPPPTLSRAAFSTLLSFVGILVSSLVIWAGGGALGSFSPSFGALATLVFAAPRSPLAQPRNVVIGNVIGAACGVVCRLGLGVGGVVAAAVLPALAVSSAIGLMTLAGAVHPPAGAVALFATLPSYHGYDGAASPLYILAPVLIGDLTLVLVGVLLNNLIDDPNFNYPQPHRPFVVQR